MIREELIGRHVEIVDADNESLVGLAGEVVDETKQTLRVRTDRGEKTVLKGQVTIRIGDHIVEGELLTKAPEKRTKLRYDKWQRKKPPKK